MVSSTRFTTSSARSKTEFSSLRLTVSLLRCSNHHHYHNPTVFVMTLILSDAAFETGIAACCGTGSLNGTDCSVNNVCTKPEEYIFFDGKHLTQEANLQVGHLMWGADKEVIGPNNLRELMVLPLDITVILADIQEAMAAMRPRQSRIENLYDIKKMESEMENHWLYQVNEASSFMI